MSNNLDEQTIYEIFRACRFCGAGGGYKMPIMPSVVGFDCEDIDLKQKIQDCLHIEVSADDKMPPLICELCVDKVNDFYEFIEMCRQNISKTRRRLGLPPMSMPQGTSDSSDCILGVTEAIHVDDDEPAPRSSRMKVKKEDKIKKEAGIKKEEKTKENKLMKEDKVKKPVAVSSSVGRKKESLMRELEKLMQPELATSARQASASARDVRADSRSSSGSFRSARSRETRSTADGDHIALSTIKAKQDQKRSETPKARSILKREKESKMKESSDDDEALASRPKRNRETEKESPKAEGAKKTKRTVKLRSPSPPTRYRAGPKSKTTKTRLPSPPPTTTYFCDICQQAFQSPQGLGSHLRNLHVIKYTPPELSCNPCGEWFPTPEETAAHHRRHKTKPYRCRGCKQNFKLIDNYNQHQEVFNCVPWTEVPDSKCERCWRLYPTRALLEAHPCGGPDNRPGGKCSKCSRNYLTMKNLKKHESICTGKKRGANATPEVKISPEVRERLMPLQIRMTKCDRLLKPKRRRYNVSKISDNFGLDRNCVYPYRSLVRVKREPLHCDGMVSINKEIQDEFYVEEDYVHWDSDLSSDSDDEYSLVNPTEKRKKVPSLTSLSLKTIFSKRCLGKVPRKLRKMKDKFDSFFNLEFDNVQSDVNSIIDNLGDDDSDKAETTSQESENLLCDVHIDNIQSGVNDIINNLDENDSEKADTTSRDSENLLCDVNKIIGEDTDNSVSAGKNGSGNDISDKVQNDSNDNTSVNVDVSKSFNYDSDSLIDQAGSKSNEDGDFDSLKNGKNACNDSKQNSCNDLVDKNKDNEIVTDKNIENEMETDVSSDENITDQNTTEKDTASENSQDIDTNNVGHLNGHSATEGSKSNGTADQPSDELIKDIDTLTYSDEEKKLIDDLDAQIGEKIVREETRVVEKERNMLEDFMPDKIQNTMNLDNVSDEEFDFDA